MAAAARLGLLLLAALVACGDDGSPAGGFDSGVAVDATVPAPDARSTECTPPTGDRVTLCGQIVDTQTDAPIVAEDASGAACDPGAPADTGPCALRLRFVDPLDFDTPLPADRVEILDSGEFRGVGVQPPFSGWIAIVVDGAPGSTAEQAPTFVVVEPAAGEQRTDLRAFATSRATDVAWTSAAGDPFGGPSFSENGAVLAVFQHGGDPVAGVAITIGGAVANAYYFSDPDAARATVAPALTATGADGSGLIVNVSLGTVSGSGSEPPGCEWPGNLGASMPGALWVELAEAHVTGEPQTPCP